MLNLEPLNVRNHNIKKIFDEMANPNASSVEEAKPTTGTITISRFCRFFLNINNSQIRVDSPYRTRLQEFHYP